MFKNLSVLSVAILCLLVCGCEDPQSQNPPVLDALNGIRDVRLADAATKTKAAAAKAMAAAEQQKPVETEGTFQVQFETTCGSFTVEVHRAWAPLGANRFYELVEDGFYNDAGFFRVVKGFMVQFGLAADPSMTYKWDRNMLDDPVVVSNTRGKVTFAKTSEPNSRSTQIFINYGDNSQLDADQFAPFGVVVKGMSDVDLISAAHRENPDQSRIKSQGNGYLKSNFPKLDYIISATIVPESFQHTGNSSAVAPDPGLPPE